MGTLNGGIWRDGEGQGKMGSKGKEQKQWDKQGSNHILNLENWETLCVPRILKTSQLVLSHCFYSWPESILFHQHENFLRIVKTTGMKRFLCLILIPYQTSHVTRVLP